MRSSIRLHSSESQHLLCNIWLLERFGTVVRVFLAIADWHTGFADVAVTSLASYLYAAHQENVPMGPMGSALPRLEKLRLEVQVLLFGEFAWRHADVLNMSDEVSLGKAGVVHGA
jgi:hypothetical protein